MLKDQPVGKQVMNGRLEASVEETVESTSVNVGISEKPREVNEKDQIAECNYLISVDEYNSVSPSYWGSLPSYSE